jgi:hypothetical protein
MKKPNQLFGNIKIGGTNVHVMACRDIDNQNEIMFHLWEQSAESARALRCVLVPNGDGMLHGSVVNFYRADDSGALRLPNLTEEEKAELRSLRIVVKLDNDKCEGHWSSSNESGNISLTKFPGGGRVQATPLESWSDFKAWAMRARTEHNIELFRGHGDSSFPLCTTFHRTGRQILTKYCDFTLPEFRSHVEAALGVRLNEDRRDFGTLLALAQHHGLPTPMLDFTKSPYIAAFFAFSDAIEQDRPDATHVRVFGITESALASSTPNIVSLTAGTPIIQRLSVSPINNPRLYAQQGQFLVTNLTDVELFITENEQTNEMRTLYAVDVPISEAVTALEDLKYMGLTAATMFPGLDGACRMMRHDMLFKAKRVESAELGEQSQQLKLSSPN